MLSSTQSGVIMCLINRSLFWGIVGLDCFHPSHHSWSVLCFHFFSYISFTEKRLTPLMGFFRIVTDSRPHMPLNESFTTHWIRNLYQDFEIQLLTGFRPIWRFVEQRVKSFKARWFVHEVGSLFHPRRDLWGVCEKDGAFKGCVGGLNELGYEGCITFGIESFQGKPLRRWASIGFLLIDIHLWSEILWEHCTSRWKSASVPQTCPILLD